MVARTREAPPPFCAEDQSFQRLERHMFLWYVCWDLPYAFPAPDPRITFHASGSSSSPAQ
jgi:hypothetical protein